ncbi:MAG: SUF system NifU family Fe-S cluster assembly protein [Erysipelotrichaceae bacterium]|nr:SUF system NifU family Fe-S cluster assembly protein [Erysipelotrichaceae bacterium]MBO4538231.1 SUF system NifU family Fe-S cluster assembly protein [Erysipelotrichaceae bacterium]MBR5049440.1 SUF system NifU family Fe-S cluster assembly protein [Erysipelotrichaceae bacterium]
MNKLLEDPIVLREIIMDHYEYPRNHSLTDDQKYKKIHMASESCIDDIHVQADIEEGIIRDVRFDGVACTISTASTSIMTQLLKGKTIEQARVIIDNYFRMIDGQDYDEELLDEAVCMKNVGKQANRIKCATIGWNGIRELLEEGEEQ